MAAFDTSRACWFCNSDVPAHEQQWHDRATYCCGPGGQSSGTMYLDQSYKRDSQKAFETVQAATSQNSEALSKADAACKERFSGWSQSYVQCVVAEQAKYPGTASVSQFVPPDPELYRHEFISPMWSPDFAGFSLIIFLLITVVIVLRIIGLVILKLLLKKHYSSI